jgi:hypothetical protein
MKKFIPLVFILLSCVDHNMNNPTDEVSSSYIVFGHFYGFCEGEKCVEIFKLTSENLYEDTHDIYPQLKAYSGDFQLLDPSLFEKVKSLHRKIPAELLNTESRSFGIPDAGDWGGLYFETIVDGEKRFWLIDKMTSNLPEYLVPFVGEIETAITIINE